MENVLVEYEINIFGYTKLNKSNCSNTNNNIFDGVNLYIYILSYSFYILSNLLLFK